MIIRDIKEELRQGKTVYGAWIQEIPFTGLIQIYSKAGFDFVVICTEHSGLNPETVAHMIQIARSLNITPIIRVEDKEYHLLAKPMDWGAGGIMVPRVETEEQAQYVVNCLKYPPVGERGMSMGTGHRDYYPMGSVSDYAKMANKKNIIMIQIETQKGLDNVEKMAAIEGVDIFNVGPLDLSFSLGVPGQLDHPKINKAVESVIRLAKKYNKSVALMGNREVIKKWHDKGVRMLITPTEVMLISKEATEAVKDFKDFLKSRKKA